MNKLRTAHGGVWSNTNFRLFTLINSLESLAIGIISAVFPLLVSQRFGSGDKLVIATTLLIAPRIFFAPFVGRVLLKKGAVVLARLSIGMLALIFSSQAFITNYTLFQSTILLRSFVGTGCIAALMTLQAWVIPKGKNIEANGVYLLTSRSLFFLAPLLVKLSEGYFTIVQYFYLSAGLLLTASLLTLSTSLPNTTSLSPEAKEHDTNHLASYRSLLKLIKEKSILLHIFIPLFGFFIINHILHLFLLWSTQQTLNASKTSYTTLLTAKGIAGFVVSFIAPISIRKITSYLPMKKLYVIARCMAITALLSLAWARNFYTAIALLMLSTIPQTLASICFYTLLQKHLTKQEQSMVHTLTYPITQSFILLGKAMAFAYTHYNYMNLQQFWLLTGIVSLTIALLPLVLPQKKQAQPC